MAERLDRIVIVAADPLRGRVAGMAVQHLLEVAPGRDVEIGPVPLSQADLGTYAAQWNAGLVLERDQLAIDRAQLLAENAKLLDQIEKLTAQRDAMAAELDAIKNPPGPNLGTVAGVKALITNQRYAIETGGITIDGQVITTERDEIGHWFPRYYDAVQWINEDKTARAINPAGVYPYKPKRGDPTALTAAQVVRAYQCMAWFVNACFATETELYSMASAEGADLAELVAAASDVATWPQTQFTWEPPT